MSTVDWTAIRTAIASRCASASGIASAGADGASLDVVGSLPSVKVLLVESIEIDEARGGRVGAATESRVAPVVGVLIVDSAPGRGQSLYRAEPLVEALFAAARVNIKLGLDYVEDWWLDSADIGEVDFNGETFIGAILRWVVKVRQTDLDRTA